MFDPTRRYVRVTRLRDDGFVEFDFAVGERDIYVEMILPARAFDEFCALNRVSFLDQATSVRIDGDAALHWRLSDVNAAISGGGGSGKNRP